MESTSTGRGAISGRGALYGLLGGVAALGAMSLFWKGVAIASEKTKERENTEEREQAMPASGSDGRSERRDRLARSLEDISLVGVQRREDENSTSAAGRILYTKLTGHEPDPATKKRVGTAVHVGYGLLVSSLYGAARGRRREGFDLLGGLGYATGLWLLGDEIAVPVLGLAKGPGAFPLSSHAQALGAHLSFGLTLAIATQALHRLLDREQDLALALPGPRELAIRRDASPSVALAVRS